MSTDRDTTRVVRSWLQTDEYESADRILDAVLDQLDTTPQRRATWWPARRLPEMNNFAKLGVATAAVVVAALLGYNYFVAPNVGGPGTEDRTPSPSPAAAQPLPASGALQPGRYTFETGPLTAVPFTFTVPAGWSVKSPQGFVIKQDGAEGEVIFATWIVSHIYGDVCQWAGSLVDVGTSAAQMAAALADQGGRETSGPTAVTVGGRAGEQVSTSVAPSFEITTCDSAYMRVWPDSGPDQSGGLTVDVGQTQVVSMVDVDGERLVIIAAHMPGASVEDIGELESIVASIEFADAP